MRQRCSHGCGISLREALPEAVLHGADDLRVTACAAEPRACRPGDLVLLPVASPRQTWRRAALAAQRGAAAVLCELPLPDAPLPVCQVDDVRNAYGRVCQALMGHPTRKLRVVAVAGARGKTTTSLLTASVLEAAGHVCGTISTLGAFDGCEHAPGRGTTPAPHVLAPRLAAMDAHGCSHAILEVSLRGLAHGHLAGVEVDTLAFTNFSAAAHAKPGAGAGRRARLLDQLQSDGAAVFNADDRIAARLGDDCQQPALTVGLEAHAEITATILDSHASEQTFLLQLGGESVPVRTALVGRHNVENCLVAAAIGVIHGADPATIARGLERVDRVPGRLERLECGQPFAVYVDCAATPRALGDALSAVRPATSGRVICVVGGEVRPRAVPAELADAAAQLADLTAVAVPGTRREPDRSRKTHVRQLAGRPEAIRWALESARPGDCVLIAGCPSRTTDHPADFHQDDRDVARWAIYASALGTAVRAA
jgi:UDP-N-acetylmuramoyl-L-alanyl-D-glutamate--2,6-diaminopimelate ligase